MSSRASNSWSKSQKTRDRCNDFWNIFAENFGEKMAFFTQN
jgi:hypothetical protein